MPGKRLFNGLSGIGSIGVLILQIVIFCDFATAAPIIANHNCTDITQISESAIVQAKADLHIAYGHTSHGSQLTTGMSSLVGFMNGLGYPEDLYNFNSGGTSGALDLRDTPFSGASDLGNPDRSAWAAATRNYLDANPAVNVVIWSWCGQVSSASQADIDLYLSLMEGLEQDYPNVKFVYMTGHLDGGGEAGNLNIRNQQIRDYCLANEKILYDFADIESYDPDGLVNYMPLLANDNCDYDSDSNGSRDQNWAVNWQNAHTQYVDWYDCSSAHSQPLNANRKAYAAWWLWARLAGWNECLPAPGTLTATADSDSGLVQLQWSDTATNPNEDAIIIQRRVDDGAWDTAYAVLPADSVSYTDQGLVVGNYQYRVVAHLDDDGTGTACDSPASNTVSAQIIATQPPDEPSDLQASADSAQRQITLTWVDNADNEDGFQIQRRLNAEPWNESYAEVGPDATAFDDSTLSPGSYTYRVVAFNAYGLSDYSNETSAEIFDVPLSPSGLTAIPQPASGTVLLAWQDNADSETGFTIDRQVDGGSWDLGYDSVAADTTTYTDNNHGGGLLPAGTYAYRVSAYNGLGVSLFSNTAQAVMAYDFPQAPFNLQSLLNGFNIVLTWSDASDNETYFVIERRVGSGEFVELIQLAADTINYTDTNLIPSLTYAYRVNAINAMGASGYSNETSQYIPNDPITIRLEDDDSNEVVDAFLRSGAPDTNYGDTAYLSSIENFIIKFNLPDELQDKRIVDAQIAFFGWNQSGFTAGEYLDLYRVVQPWSEGTVTWSQSETGVSWSTPGGDYDSVQQVGQIPFEGGCDHCFFTPLEITNLVQAWADGTIENNGLILINNSSLSTGIKASEYSNGSRSYLEITYEPCIVDSDADGDVDSADLAVMASGFDGACIKALADNFGAQ